MLREHDLNSHLRGSLHDFVEVIDLKPQQHAVAVGLMVWVADWPVMVMHVKAVQLKDELSAVDQLLVGRSAVIAAASEQTLIPPAAGFDIGDGDERLGTHGGCIIS